MDRLEVEGVVREMTSAMKDSNTSPRMADKIESWRNRICVATDTRIPS